MWPSPPKTTGGLRAAIEFGGEAFATKLAGTEAAIPILIAILADSNSGSGSLFPFSRYTQDYSWGCQFRWTFPAAGEHGT